MRGSAGAAEPGTLPNRDLVRDYPWLILQAPRPATGDSFAGQPIATAIAADESLADGQLHLAPSAAIFDAEDLVCYRLTRPVEVTSIQAVTTVMGMAPILSRGLLIIRGDADGPVTQVFNVVRNEFGLVLFLDGQTGGQAVLPATPGRVEFLPTAGAIPPIPLSQGVSGPTAAPVTSVADPDFDLTWARVARRRDRLRHEVVTTLQPAVTAARLTRDEAVVQYGGAVRVLNAAARGTFGSLDSVWRARTLLRSARARLSSQEGAATRTRVAAAAVEVSARAAQIRRDTAASQAEAARLRLETTRNQQHQTEDAEQEDRNPESVRAVEVLDREAERLHKIANEARRNWSDLVDVSAELHRQLHQDESRLPPSRTEVALRVANVAHARAALLGTARARTTAAKTEARRRGDVLTARDELKAAERRLHDRATSLQRWQNRLDADLTNLGSGSGYLGTSTEIALTPATANLVRGLVDEALATFWDQHVPSRAVRDRLQRDFGELTVDTAPWLRHEVAPKVRADIREEVREFATASRLRADLPALHTPSGSQYILGQGASAVRVTLRVKPVQRSAPAGNVAGTDPRSTTEVQNEVRAGKASSADAAHATSTFRDLVLPSFRWALGLGNLPWLKTLTPGLDLKWTVNQFHRSAFTSLAANSFHVQRNRDPSVPSHYDLTWSAMVESATGAPFKAVARRVADPDPLVVWFSDHIARPRQKPIDVVSGPVTDAMMVVDALHDPGALETEVRTRIAQLDALDPESQRHLLVFLSNDNVRGGAAVLRTDGLLSVPLLGRDGKLVGSLRLQAIFTPRRDLARARRNPLELYHKGTVAEIGSAGLRSGISVGITGSGVFVGRREVRDTVNLGTYTTFGLTAGATLTTETSSMQQSGGSGVIYRGLKSGMVPASRSEPTGPTPRLEPAPARIADADVRWIVTLQRSDSTLASVRWNSLASEHKGARVRLVPEDLGPADPNLHPPAGIEYGGRSGFANVDQLRPGGRTRDHSGLSVRGQVDTQVHDWLVHNGYARMDGSASDNQAVQYQRLLNVMSADYREANWDDFEGEGIWTPFERVTWYGGVERVMVRWKVSRTQGRAVHEGASATNRVIFNPESNVELEGSYTSAGSGSARLGFDLNVGLLSKDKPFSQHLPNLPLTFGPYQYGGESSHESPTGWSYAREVFFQQQDGEPTQTFGVNLHLIAEIYSSTSNTPVWTYEAWDGTSHELWSARFWVPDFRVLSQLATRPDQPTAPRNLTSADLTALGRPAEARLPAMTGVAEIAGSPELNAVFRALSVEVAGGVRGGALAALTGVSLSTEASPSAQVRRNLLSPARLRPSSERLMGSALASDQLFESGAFSQHEGHIKLVAYNGRPRYVGPRAGSSTFYLEDWVHVTDGGAEGRATSRSHHISPVTASGPRFRLGKWLVTVPVFGYRVSATNAKVDETTADATDTRVTVHEGPIYTILIPLTFIATISAASRNNMRTMLAVLGVNNSKSRVKAIDVPDAIEAHLNVDELFDVWRAMRAADALTTLAAGPGPAPHPILDLPATTVELLRAREGQALVDEALRQAHQLSDDPQVRYVPRRLAQRDGLGIGTVYDVREARRGVAGTPPPVPVGEPTLYHHAAAELDWAVSRVARPGSSTYMPGAHQKIADLVAPEALRAMLPRYFEAGAQSDPSGEMTLKSFTFRTTRHGGAVDVTVAVKARPAPGFETVDQRRRIFGRQSNTAGMENYESPGKAATVRRNRTIAHGFTAGVAALSPGAPSTVRTHTPAINVELVRTRGRGAMRAYRSGPRAGTKAYEDSVNFAVPLELTVQARVTPAEESVNALGPSAIAGGAAALARVMSFAGWPVVPRPTTWIPVVALVRVPRSDTTARPITFAPPPWQRRPTSVPAGLRDVVSIAMDGTLPSAFQEEAQQWPKFSRMPDDYQVNWFNGNELLALSARAVVPRLAGTERVADAIKDWLAGRSTNAALHQILRPEGDQRTYRVDDLSGIGEIEGTVTVSVTHASGWAGSTDHTEPTTEGTPPSSFAVGEGNDVILETAPIRSTTSRVTSVIRQRLGLQVTAGTANWIRKAVVAKKLGSAPGNQSSVVFNWFNAAVTGGEPARTSASHGAASRRGIRFPGKPLAPSTSAGGNSHRLVFRHLLINVAGSSRWRLKGTSTWRAIDPAEQAAVLATIEILAPSSQLPTAQFPSPTVLGQAPGDRPGSVLPADAIAELPELSSRTGQPVRASSRWNSVADIARRYSAATDPDTRHELLSDVIAQANAPMLGVLAAQIADSTHDDATLADVGVMRAAEKALTGDIVAARAEVRRVLPELAPAAKPGWVAWLHRLGVRNPEHQQQLSAVATAIVACPPRRGYPNSRI